MRSTLACAALLVLAYDSMAQGIPPAQVQVSFDHPEKFRDASLNSPGNERGPDPEVMKALTRHLEKLGQRYLQPGQRVHIDIRDIDLAGRYEPWNSQAYNVSCAKSPGRPSTSATPSFNPASPSARPRNASATRCT